MRSSIGKGGKQKKKREEMTIEIYEKETEELDADTERIKNHIAQMLKELKNA